MSLREKGDFLNKKNRTNFFCLYKIKNNAKTKLHIHVTTRTYDTGKYLHAIDFNRSLQTSLSMNGFATASRLLWDRVWMQPVARAWLLQWDCP